MGRTDGQIGGGIKNARVVFLVHDTSAQCHACTLFHEYIPYSLGVMAGTPFTICN